MPSLTTHNTPALRFPGYTGVWEQPQLRFKKQNGEAYSKWTARTVADVFAFNTTKNKNCENNNVITNSALYGLIPQQDYFDRNIAVEGNTSHYTVIQKNDFVYNPRKSAEAPFGPFNCYHNDKPGIVSPLYTCLTTKDPSHIADTDYLQWYFKTSRWHQYIITHGAQNGARHDRVGMTNTLMEGIPVDLPSDIEEQRKIGSFFNHLDGLINLHQRQTKKLTELKQGLLHEMFPQEGESVPRLRFPGFTDTWEQKQSGDIAPLRGGFAFKSDSYTDSGVPIVCISNLLSDGTVGGEYVHYDKKELDKNFVLYNNAVLLAMSGATAGKVSILRDDTGKMYYQNQRVGYFMPTNKCDYTFIQTLMRTPLFRDQLVSILEAGAQPNISANDIDRFIFPIPSSYEEQKQIGSFFNHLDGLINLHQQQTEKLTELKKGLLQKMFPQD